jgi:parvulin-like peptidyl-prolyl isomerase
MFMRDRMEQRMVDWTRVWRRPARSVLLPAIGATIGLAAGAYGLFRAAPLTLAVPAGYVAVVNQKGILNSDFIAQTASATGKPFEQTTRAERSKTLQAMIDEELLVQRGVLLDLPETTTEVRDVMTAAVNAQAEAASKGTPPGDAQLQAYYQAHRANYSTTGTMQVRDLLLRVGGYQNANQSTSQAQTDAEDALYRLRAGTAVEQVMQHFGFVDSGRADAGEVLDFAAKLHLGAKLFPVAAALSDGQISEPIVDADGVHLLLMQRRQAPRLSDFASVRPKVYADYVGSVAKRAQDEELGILRRDAQILISPEARL